MTDEKKDYKDDEGAGTGLEVKYDKQKVTPMSQRENKKDDTAHPKGMDSLGETKVGADKDADKDKK